MFEHAFVTDNRIQYAALEHFFLLRARLVEVVPSGSRLHESFAHIVKYLLCDVLALSAYPCGLCALKVFFESAIRRFSHAGQAVRRAREQHRQRVRREISNHCARVCQHTDAHQFTNLFFRGRRKLFCDSPLDCFYSGLNRFFVAKPSERFFFSVGQRERLPLFLERLFSGIVHTVNSLLHKRKSEISVCLCGFGNSFFVRLQRLAAFCAGLRDLRHPAVKFIQRCAIFFRAFCRGIQIRNQTVPNCLRRLDIFLAPHFLCR